jgi:hypothetical protein
MISPPSALATKEEALMNRRVTPNATLVDLLEHNRGVDQAVCYMQGENAERRLPYGEVYARALGILHLPV